MIDKRSEATERWGAGRSRLLYALMLATLALFAFAFTSEPASANNGMTQVSGSGYVDYLVECLEYPDMDGLLPDYAIVLEGDLAGCVYIYVDWDRTFCTPSGVYVELGLEHYDINGGNLALVGTYESDYRFTGKFEDCSDYGSEIFGRCQHPVNPDSGTGDFAGVTGRLDFKDDVEAGCSYYRGHFRFP